MGYCGCMGYEVFFPANQLGGVKKLRDLREYGVCEPWVTTYEGVDCTKNRNRSAVRRTVECIRLFPSKLEVSATLPSIQWYTLDIFGNTATP